jgi:hypothetical protein
MDIIQKKNKIIETFKITFTVFLSPNKNYAFLLFFRSCGVESRSITLNNFHIILYNL